MQPTNRFFISQALMSKTQNSTTRAAGIPYPQLCTPSSPPSKTVRLHNHSDHRDFSS